MTLAAAVLVTAAVPVTGAVPSGAQQAVRAEVRIAGDGNTLDVTRIRVLDGLRAGESYRLPALGIRNERNALTTYRLVASVDASHPGNPPPRGWLRFVPTTVAIDVERSRRLAVRLELPHDAEPGPYAVVLGVRPGGSEGARLTFRIEPADSTRPWTRQGASLVVWVLPVFVGAVLVVFLVRVNHETAGSERARNV